MIQTIDRKIIKSHYFVLMCFLALSFVFDFVDKIDRFYQVEFIKFNRILKGLIFIYAIFFIVKYFKKIMNDIPYIGYSFFALCLIFAIKFDYWELYYQEFFRYSFLFIIYPLVYFEFFETENFQIRKRHIYLFLRSLIIINTIAVCGGLLFDIYGFKTYNSFGRFGFNGILISQGLTPYVYLAATLMFWHFKDKLMMLLVLIISALSGIKGVYLGEFILIVLLVIFDTNLSKSLKIKISVLSAAIFISGLAIILNMSPFKEIISEDGLISALFSFRISNLIEIMDMNATESFNFFIGGIGLYPVTVEMQLVDVFLFFGCIGIFIYIYLFYHLFKIILLKTQSLVFFITVLFLSALSGNLLYNPIATTLFLVTICCITPPKKFNSTNSVS